MIRRFFIFLGLLLAVPFWLSAPAGMLRAADYLGSGFLYCGHKVPLERTEVYESIDQELLLLSEAKSRIYLTLRRRDRYLPIVEKALKDQGVHSELKYLPMTLTGLNPSYRSGSRRGLWRLSEGEAKAYGLKVEKDLDERLDPVSSSEAAARRLKALHDSYGDWFMATAAYLDESDLAEAISESGGLKDYFALYLPESLEKSMSQVLAGKAIFSDPGRYGYSPGPGWPVLARRRLTLSAAQDMRSLAANNKTDYKTFRDMNPQVLSSVAPAGATLNIP
jgi:hypothetical protein